MKKRTAEELTERRLHRRAVVAVIWGMPAANFELMRSVMSPDQRNQFLYWSRLLDWRNQTLTPNPDLSTGRWSGTTRTHGFIRGNNKWQKSGRCLT
jgi:hypothetical protein